MSLPDLVVFDLGRVLIDVDFERFVHAIGHDEAARAALRAFTSGDDKLSSDRGEISPRELAQRAIDLTSINVQADKFLRAWVDIFRPFSRARRAIAALRGRTELWMLSDTDPLHFHRAFEDYDYVRGFDRYLLSYVEGRLKRDTGAFEPLAERARAGARVVFIDDVADHVERARAAGVDAVLFRAWDDPTLPDWLRRAAEE